MHGTPCTPITLTSASPLSSLRSSCNQSFPPQTQTHARILRALRHASQVLARKGPIPVAKFRPITQNRPVSTSIPSAPPSVSLPCPCCSSDSSPVNHSPPLFPRPPFLRHHSYPVALVTVIGPLAIETVLSGGAAWTETLLAYHRGNSRRVLPTYGRVLRGFPNCSEISNFVFNFQKSVLF